MFGIQAQPVEKQEMLTLVLLGRKRGRLYHRQGRETSFHCEAFEFCNYLYKLPTQNTE